MITLSENATAAEELKDARQVIEILHSENEKLRSDLANVQQNLAGSVEFNNQSVKMCDETEATFSNLSRDFQQINVSTIEQVESVANSRILVDKSSDQLNAVKSATELIKNLADQTKLLALNAQIEAARAGTAGAGFSIVAQEVKALSNETEAAARKIEQSVKAIDTTSQQMSECIHSLETASEEIKETTVHFDTKIHQAQKRNTEILERVVSSTDRVFMSLVKLDHIIWKVNTYRSLLTRTPQFEFVDHHNCRLGKWYCKGEGQASFSQSPSFLNLEKPHSIVHSSTKHLFVLLEHADGSLDLDEVSNLFTEMEHSSDKVFTILDQILSEKQASSVLKG